jgi:exopolysaccharide production protein ExoZ
MARQYFRSLQAGRALAALAVVFHHATINMGPYFHPDLWSSERIDYFGRGFAFGVSYFFVLSGIVIYAAHQQDIGKPARLRRYALRRFIRVYPVYWMVLTPFLVHFALARYRPGALVPTSSSVATSLTLVQIHAGHLIVPVGWTLTHEVQFYLLFGVVILQRRLGAVLIGLWFALALVHWVVPFVLAPWMDSWTSPFHLMFAAGIFCGWWIHSRQVPQPVLLLVAGAGTMLAAMVGASLNGVHVGGYMVAGLGSMLMLLGSVGLEQKGRLHIPRVLEFLAEASYSIYLVHGFVLEKFGPVLYRFLPAKGLPMILPLVLLCVIGTVVGILVHVLLERPLLRALRKWFETTPAPVPRIA